MSIDSEKTDSPLRLFLYVDHYKLSSISSQLFAGFTEQVIQELRDRKSESETQKGEFASGRLLADESQSESMRQERRLVHDFAYTAMEKELTERGKVLVIERGTSVNLDQIDTASFVKITGQTTFLDLQAIANFTTEFNKFGEAIAYTTTVAEREQADSTLREQLSVTKDRNAKERVKAQLRAISNVGELAKKMNMHHDQKNLDAIAYLLRTGFGDHFELQVRHEDQGAPLRFSGLLKREYLREAENVIVKKYGREAQRDFTLLGTVSQRGGVDRRPHQETEIKHLRDAIENLVLHIRNIEEGFFSPYEHEVVLDPIAVYSTL